MIEMWTDNEN